MTGLEIAVERQHDAVVVRLMGVLDGETARAVAGALDELPACPLTLDFSGVRTFVDLSVAALTQALRARPVRLRGLGRHQQRMFRYFGVTSSEVDVLAAVEA